MWPKCDACERVKSHLFASLGISGTCRTDIEINDLYNECSELQQWCDDLAYDSTAEEPQT